MPPEHPTEQSEEWRKLLVEGHKPMLFMRGFFRHLPSSPRCKVCNSPFSGIGGRIGALAGFKPSHKNPNLCMRCCDDMNPGGAEVDVAVLFADVRGSTALGERAAPTEFAELLNRFYGAATDALLEHDAVIDKLIGDEVMALFIPGVAGPDYRRRAVDAGRDLLAAVGYGGGEQWLDLGVAVHAGLAFVGNVGGAVVDFTALGDTVNTAARMQGHAAAGELLVSAGVADEAVAGAPRRTLEIRGREETVDAFVVTA
jgi:adenylate cyclase